MNILLSAYSINPYKGSEDAVGWNWALTLSRKLPDSTIYILTRTYNEIATKKELKNTAYKTSNSLSLKFLKHLIGSGKNIRHFTTHIIFYGKKLLTIGLRKVALNLILFITFLWATTEYAEICINLKMRILFSVLSAEGKQPCLASFIL